MNDRPLILYHGNCTDGFGAAWAAYKKFGYHATYKPVSHGGPVPIDDAKGRDVYLLDFCYDAPTLTELLSAANKLTVIDHHATAIKAVFDNPPWCQSMTLDRHYQVTGNFFAYFSRKKSGAVLAWEHFKPFSEVPDILRYVQAGDLWDWHDTDGLNYRRQIHAYLTSYPMTFDWWDFLEKELAVPPLDAADVRVQQGAAILRARKRVIDRLCDNKRIVVLGGHEVWAANAPCHQSYVAEALIEGDEKPFGAAWFADADGLTIWSLRSREGFDASKVASAYGGGGHARAAGFQLHIDRAREILWPTNSPTGTSASPTP